MRAAYALSGLRGDASDSALPANRCSKHLKGHSDGVRIYRTYRPMNGQPMLPKWPNDGSSHTMFGWIAEIVGRTRESRPSEAAGRGNSPEAKPRKMNGRKRVAYCAQEQPCENQSPGAKSKDRAVRSSMPFGGAIARCVGA